MELVLTAVVAIGCLVIVIQQHHRDRACRESIFLVNLSELFVANGIAIGGRLLVVVWILGIIVSQVYTARRGAIFVDAVLGEHGVWMSLGSASPNPVVCWNEVARWFWSRTPTLHLNLYDGRAVHSISVEEAEKEVVEQVLLKKLSSPVTNVRLDNAETL